MNLSNLPPIDTVTTPPARRQSAKRMSAKAKRTSTFSNASSHGNLPIRSRPQSTVLPAFGSSLPYALVRDFAYPSTQPMHYGPPPESASSVTTPASEFQRRLSDPPPASWHGAKVQWPAGLEKENTSFFGVQQLPATAYTADGPPWKEDDDLHSPIVTSSKHKKTKSNYVDFDFSRSRAGTGHSQGRRTSYAGTHSDGGQLYYVDQLGEPLVNGPGGEFINYSTDEYRYASEPNEDSPSPEEYDDADEGDSRYSRDYSFTIASPDEEVHGKAVALFDFERENDNELPLTEGQILWVSYRHEQGWLVAQDPRSGESGLVPEEYVRLVRDIEGGLNSLNGLGPAQLQTLSSNDQDQSSDTADVDTPVATTWPAHLERQPSGSKDSHQYPSVVSHFSTSSRDLQPYPQHLLDQSQTSTPTSQTEGPFRRVSEEKERSLPAKGFTEPNSQGKSGKSETIKEEETTST